VDHLAAELGLFDLAGHDAHRADGVALGKPFAEASEEHQGHQAGGVGDLHAPGLGVGTGLLMVLDHHLEGHHLAVAGRGQHGGRAAHQGVGLEPQHIAHDRTRQPFQQRGHARAHALEGRDRGKEREQNLRPHGASIARPPPGAADRIASRRVRPGHAGVQGRTALYPRASE
jgi:hypothetical protein